MKKPKTPHPTLHKFQRRFTRRFLFVHPPLQTGIRDIRRALFPLYRPVKVVPAPESSAFAPLSPRSKAFHRARIPARSIPRTSGQTPQVPSDQKTWPRPEYGRDRSGIGFSAKGLRTQRRVRLEGLAHIPRASRHLRR